MNAKQWLPTIRLGLGLCVGLAACSEDDTTAPPAPWVDPVQSPTSEASVVLTGSAEYGSTIIVRGGASEVRAVASAFTALWRAQVDLNTAIPAGAVSLKNNLSVTAVDSSGNTSKATALEIEFGPPPGEATTLGFELTGPAADGVIAAGDELAYVYAPKDAYGHVADNPVIVVMTAPDAVVLDDGLSGTGLVLGLTRAGNYTIKARAAGGSGVSETLAIEVQPAAGDRLVDLSLTLTSMAVGQSVLALAVVRDLYGNVLTSPSPSYAIESQDPSMTDFFTLNANEFTVTKPGVYKITATYDDGVNPAASDYRYLLVEQLPDLAPPTVALENVRRNGNVCASDVACTWVNGDTLTFDVDVTDDVAGIAQVSYVAFFATAGGAGTSRTRSVLVPQSTLADLRTFSFTIPNATTEDVELVAQAIDAAGNLANSAAWMIRVRPILATVRDGNTCSLVTTGIAVPGGGASTSDAVRDAEGRLVVADRNNDRIWRQSGSTFVTLATLGDPPEQLVAAENGDVFASVRGNRQSVVRIDAAGGQTDVLDLNNVVDPAGDTCDPGNGAGIDPQGLALLPMRRARVRVGPGQPAIADSDGDLSLSDGSTTKTYDWTALGGDVCGTRNNLATLVASDAFPNVARLPGPCFTPGNATDDFGDLELVAGPGVVPGAVALANLDSDPNIQFDQVAIDVQETLFVGTRSRYALHANDAAMRDGTGCYNARHTFAAGESWGVAATFEAGNLVVYAADEPNNRVRRLAYNATGASSSESQVHTGLGAPTDVGVLPSGCLVVVESNNDRLSTIDTRSCTTGCTRTTIVDGFANVVGLTVDAATVIASRDTTSATSITLRARVAGASGNGLALSTSNATAFVVSPFAGGTNGPPSTYAVGSVAVSASGWNDGDTITVGSRVYELDTNVSVGAGRIAVRPGALTQAAIAATLEASIAGAEVRVMVTDSSANAVVEVGPSENNLTDCF